MPRTRTLARQTAFGEAISEVSARLLLSKQRSRTLPTNEIVLSDLGQAHNQKAKADTYYGSRGFVVSGAIVTHLTELGAGVADSLGDLRIVSKQAICDLWVKSRSALVFYRDKWLPDNLPANLQAAESIKSRIPKTGWLTRALSHGSPFVTSKEFLKEWRS